MLLQDGTIKITDFGIARFARSETRTLTDKAIGSVHYISPEQAAGDVIDARTDIYSVGVMLYEMLTGKVPFEADTPVSVALKQIQSRAVPPRQLNPQIPEGLQEITLHAMEKDVHKRYQSAAQMLRDIDADYYVMIDGDDTYPADQVRDLLQPLLDGVADHVVGDRLSNGTYGEENKRAFHGFGNNLVRAMIKWIYGYGFDDVMTGYRAFSRAFVKTFPVLSEGPQIETELSIHAVDRRWRILDVPIVYRDRPEGSVSKLDTVGDGIKVIMMIGTLFKDYRPLKFFSLVALVLTVLGLVFGVPVIIEYFQTGLVPRLPTALLAVALIFLACLALVAGFILDSVAKSERREWEFSVYREVMRKNGMRPAMLGR